MQKSADPWRQIQGDRVEAPFQVPRNPCISCLRSHSLDRNVLSSFRQIRPDLSNACRSQLSSSSLQIVDRVRVLHRAFHYVHPNRLGSTTSKHLAVDIRDLCCEIRIVKRVDLCFKSRVNPRSIYTATPLANILSSPVCCSR